MRILIDLQALQTPGAATRGVGGYTNGLLSALASSHEVVGLRRARPYLVPPTASVPTVEIQSGISQTELERLVSNHHFDVVVNCSGPYWEENLVVSGMKKSTRPLIASIFYDVIPWVFPHVYLQDPQFRRSYHNRCVDLYARADLVCAISHHSECDAIRFGYATPETATTISLGVRRLVAEVGDAREKWKIPGSYLLSVSGDDFRKNPEMLITAFLQSSLRKSRCLVVVISNDAVSGFSSRMKVKYGNLRAQGVIVLPGVTAAELGTLYRDCEAFVFASLYEGFGIPLVEAMQYGKWVISSRSSSLAEVSGPALLTSIEDPNSVDSIILALHQAAKRLDEGPLDESKPRDHAQKFSWPQVVQNFENAVTRRRETVALNLSTQSRERLQLFWASPLPGDVSGIAFYSEDLVGLVGRHYDIVLVPNTVSTFVPTPKTGRFKIVEPHAEAVSAMTNSDRPLVFYNIGNSEFHLELLDLLFKIPGIVLLHDSFVKGLEGLWRDRIVWPTANPPLSKAGPLEALRRGYRVFAKIDRLLSPVQPTQLRRKLSRIARLPGMRQLVLGLAAFLRGVASGVGAWRTSVEVRLRSDSRLLDVRIIESSRVVLFLGEHAKSLIGPEHLAERPTHVVPLYCRYRGPISSAKKTELRRKYGIPEDAFVVTTSGFQAPIKLTAQVIRSSGELDRFEGNAGVYAQVLGQFADRAYEVEVRTLLRSSGLRGFISKSFVDEVTLMERVALTDVAIYLRSWSTGGPSAGLNDALGMGIPCIVTDDFALREYPKTAVLRVSNSEVTEGLMLLYRYPEVRQAFVKGALEYAWNMSPERVAERLCKIFSLYDQNGSTRIRSGDAENGSKTTLPHVFVDITYGLMHKARSGLQRVEREIARELWELDPEARHFIYVAWDDHSRRFRIVSLNHLMQREILPPLETWLPARPEADIGEKAHLFVLGSNWPLGEPYFSHLLALVRQGVQLSVLIPDLIPLRHRWDFYAHHPKGTPIDYFRAFCLEVVPVCKNVLTISNYSMADIQKLLLETGPVTPEKRDVPKVYALKLGADWGAPIVDEATTVLSRSRQVQNPYVLCVSTLERRKNHEQLLKAFIKVRSKVNNLDLVLVGGIDGSIPETTLEFCRQSAWIRHFERVDDITLRQLYEECLFTVYPSLDEGYGLPVIESFRYGKFCLASEAGAIPEAGGVFADYFDPKNVEVLAEKILTYVTNPEALQRKEKSLASYRPTSWRETAWQVAQIFYGDRAKDIFMTQGSSEHPVSSADT